MLVRKLLMGYRSMVVCMMSMSRTFRTLLVGLRWFVLCVNCFQSFVEFHFSAHCFVGNFVFESGFYFVVFLFEYFSSSDKFGFYCIVSVVYVCGHC